MDVQFEADDSLCCESKFLITGFEPLGHFSELGDNGICPCEYDTYVCYTRVWITAHTSMSTGVKYLAFMN